MSKEDILKELATYLNLEYVANQSETKLIRDSDVFTLINRTDVFHISVDDIKGQGFSMFVECVLSYHGYVLTQPILLLPKSEPYGNIYTIGNYTFYPFECKNPNGDISEIF